MFTTCPDVGAGGRPNDKMTAVRQANLWPAWKLFPGDRIFCLANNVTNFSSEGLRCERFLEQLVTRIKFAMVPDLVIGVSRDVEHFHVGPKGAELRSQLMPVHMRHDDVGNKQV